MYASMQSIRVIETVAFNESVDLSAIHGPAGEDATLIDSNIVFDITEGGNPSDLYLDRPLRVMARLSDGEIVNVDATEDNVGYWAYYKVAEALIDKHCEIAYNHDIDLDLR